MMAHYESQIRDQRSRLSFLFGDLRRVISDIRHLRKAATFGRLCSSTNTGSRMFQLHSSLVDTMNEKVFLYLKLLTLKILNEVQICVNGNTHFYRKPTIPVIFSVCKQSITSLFFNIIISRFANKKSRTYDTSEISQICQISNQGSF